MVRGILIFVILWALFAAALSTWRSWSARGAWKLSKTLGLASLAAALTVLVLAGIVIFF
jgi:hypothetical protein